MERLKRLREERRLSQVKLAARADLNPATVNQIERGMRDASPGTLRKLADALEVSLYELMEDEAPKKVQPPRDQPAESSAGAVEESEPDALAGTIHRLSVWGKEAAGSGARSTDLLRDLKVIDDVFEEAFHAYRTREARGEEAGSLARSIEELVVASVAVEEAMKEAAREEADPGKKAQIADFVEHRDRRGTARTLGLGQAEAG
ncbi:MAG: helix-turn-helix domain-containing protein [Actinomycetota bacterium]|nr:helix-turn-helix domain-containing protein [Actinomycetota bacterium]MDP9485130.1 helix-turn-helix domain-containing protein [Actinomycetota bacterium]